MEKRVCSRCGHPEQDPKMDNPFYPDGKGGWICHDCQILENNDKIRNGLVRPGWPRT